MLGVELDEDDAAAIDPLAYALVGAAFSAVRRWVSREPRRPDTAEFASLLSDSVWLILDGHARRLGVEIDPDLPIEELLNIPDPEAAQAMSHPPDDEVVQQGVGEADQLDRLWTPHRIAYIRGENKPSRRDGRRVPVLPDADDGRRGRADRAPGAAWPTPCSTSTPTRPAT